ncbi:Exoenzyme regulatory protein AepA precursor [Pseudomonas chlororaphis subsp. aureofaciens]|uniref:Exoenzyme regulatory protein AepA n=1 Tax=Pseudomonas chlororaphis subsp. aureofaciens TaxID=587851 RepID=A0AAD0ZK58_9PSED|nr:amidohydrolase [Pseudomonas chlororaphis]AZE24360.1 Exoenzyme regulatory protein AepA precursor [Pseudomonas chlororaphis subsp. aureofaciens]AZE30644.1 Exoenzyme regulatory protein AepA precursor [Pseudomonas chlororaphis subsp. aureofaciens]AZE36961.1 Exoenzyme regulatory protein AepA precursor [Pseudomonas chlororaphis subsp. aureofaciens]AZE43276.1 Exoenzyme regulatory protein AepA precursor [Pseudomonas chlororaphis subsp. aureofaciens]QHC90379.1 amidohydrolase [Pseudomonas chlororaphi
MKRFIPNLLTIAVSFASMEAMAATDLVLFNGQVFTADRAQPKVQALAVADGKVLQVGSDAQIKALIETGTRVIDLGGKTLMPGLIDSHSHAIFGGLEMTSANMQDQVVSLDELERKLRAWRDDGKARHGDVLSIAGMSSAYWAQAEALGQRFNAGEWARVPVVFTGSDHHTAWANAVMLERAGIDAALLKTLPQAERDTIGQLADGRPNGFLVDAGWDRVAAKMPVPSSTALLNAAQSAVRYNNSLGITAWMDPAANAAPGEAVFALKPTAQTVGVLPAYKALAESGGMSAHVAALLVANPKSRPADLDVLEQVRQQFQGIPNLTLPGVKIFADGVIEYPAQSAAMIDPYSNSRKQGELLIDPEHFGELVSAIDQRGWRVHIHAIGDRAVRESLNGIAQARQDRQSGIAHSITHLQMVNPKEFTRFKPLGVIASMQLLWASADDYTLDMIKPYVSALAFRYQYPAHSLLKQGATLAGASDWPVSSPNPWNAIAQAITRKGPLGVLNADERLDRETMFYAYTLNAARAIGLEQQIGSLSAGKQADFIVLDRDVFRVDEKALHETQVLQTWFAGREVYARPL